MSVDFVHAVVVLLFLAMWIIVTWVIRITRLESRPHDPDSGR